MAEKLKFFLTDDRFFTSILVSLVAVTAFLLGQASVEQSRPAPEAVTLMAAPESMRVTGGDGVAAGLALAGTAPEIQKGGEEGSVAGQFVASKSGTRYHAVTCPGASQIKASNKIYFDTADAAEAAGYTRAANCPER